MSERLLATKPSGIRELFNRAQGLEGIISLGIGQPDIPTPQKLVELIGEAAASGENYYTPNSGAALTRQKVAEMVERDWGNAYNPSSEVVLGCGASEILYDSVKAWVNPGEEVLIPNPGFVYYPQYPILASAKPIYYDSKPDLTIDLDALNEVVSSKSRMILLNSPGNPSGVVQPRKVLEGIAEIAEDNDLIILSDEVYSRIIFDDYKHYSMSALAPERSIVVSSFSKMYCAPGWRLGFAVGPAKLIEPVAKYHAFVTANAPSIVQFAVAGFIGTPEEEKFTKELVRILAERRKVVEREIKKMYGLDSFHVQGSFYAFPRISEDLAAKLREAYPQYSTSGKALSELAFEKAKVVVVPGDEFGPSGNDRFRISFGSGSVEKIEEAMIRIGEALNSL